MPQNVIKLKGNTYYIDSAVNIGLISDDNGRTIIIDTGLDDDGRRMQSSWRSKPYHRHNNTRSTADHAEATIS